MARDQEIQITDPLGEEEDLVQYSISSYGADYPIDGLVRRIGDGSIYVPDFQRAYVWTWAQASRFVESLLLGLPVPGIFLARDEDTQKLIVIDGQQRLRTLQYFYEGIFSNTGREFKLRNVQRQLVGVTYKSLSDEDRRRLDDSILHATIVRQDEPSEDSSSIHHIFERLNTGGTQLSLQEIRTAMSYGEFSGLLQQLNQLSSWRSIYGQVSPRMRDQELILRFLALYFESDRYERPMKDFLNLLMKRNRHLSIYAAEQLTTVFTSAIKLIAEAIGPRAFKPRRAFVAAAYDAVMVGVARRLQSGPLSDSTEFKERFLVLQKTEKFNKASTTETSDPANIDMRISLATEAFANCP